MKSIPVLIFVTLFIFWTGCFIDDDDGPFDCVNGRGSIDFQEFSLPDFEGIELNCAADIILRHGPQQLVEVEGFDNVIDEIDFDIDGDDLEIDFDRCIDSDDLPVIYITLPDLEKVVIRGSGDVVSENLFVINDLELRTSGSGEIDLAIKADDLDVRIPGSGDIYLEGEADELDLEISGSGDFEAFNLLLNEADISISGSGDTEVLVENYLRVRISGSGNVFYRGFPDLDIDISGSGKVIERN